MVEHSSQERLFPPPAQIAQSAHIKGMSEYSRVYRESIEDPEGFWGEQAAILTWYKKWNKVREFDFSTGEIKWFEGGKLNASYNCLDRHLKAGMGDRTAIIWGGNEPDEGKRITYRELYTEVCRFANVLKRHGVKKGDTVTIYMPMIPELPIAMLACARIGAVHSVVFGGFSAESLRGRIMDCRSRVVVVANGGMRANKCVPMKANCDIAIKDLEFVKHCIVVRRVPDLDVGMVKGRDVWWHEEMAIAPEGCEPEVMDAEDPLFILYTSGSTGRPKGVLHTTGGYLVYVALTHKYVFDYHEGDIYWCTADIGWVTGHSYIVYGPLANCATTVIFEGVPSYPTFGRFWDVVDEHKVTQFYTAPTAIRACMREGDHWVKNHDLSSLRILGSVGEPINPEAWMWYYDVVGRGRCPIVDTWWQTETGGILITPLPGATPLKPGSATFPFFGVEAVVLDEKGREVKGEGGGVLCIKSAWPSIARTLYGDPERFKQTYFQMYKGYYFTGDGVRRDADGYYWITGRVDDVINVSGHRIGTAEIEYALASHPAVAETAVVGMPHDLKGQGICAFVTLKTGIEKYDALKKELIDHVRKEIGPIATPDKIHWAEGLPKTRSGKIMRRILRKIAAGQEDQIGDISTLADPSVVQALIGSRMSD
ncbi:MAG: acetate--CoA ligase [Candidatus Thermoplasmatota archaeon]